MFFLSLFYPNEIVIAWFSCVVFHIEKISHQSEPLFSEAHRILRQVNAIKTSLDKKKDV